MGVDVIEGMMVGRVRVTEFYFRGDSACYEKNLIGWLRNEPRESGPHGPVGFAISVRLHPSLKQHILRLPASAWKPYREDGEAVSECADVPNYWPEAEEEKEFGPHSFTTPVVPCAASRMLAGGTGRGSCRCPHRVETHRSAASSQRRRKPSLFRMEKHSVRHHLRSAVSLRNGLRMDTVRPGPPGAPVKIKF